MNKKEIKIVMFYDKDEELWVATSKNLYCWSEDIEGIFSKIRKYLYNLL